MQSKVFVENISKCLNYKNGKREKEVRNVFKTNNYPQDTNIL